MTDAEKRIQNSGRLLYQIGAKDTVAEIIAMMEDKKDRAEHFNGQTMCEYWITVLKAKYLK